MTRFAFTFAALAAPKQLAFTPSVSPITRRYFRHHFAKKWTPKASISTSTSPRPIPSTFRLAPSDFAFLWEECKRCFYLKAHGQLYRPRAPFPSIFGAIDIAMKRHFRGLRTTSILPDMPPGVFLCEEDDAWVESLPITVPNHSTSVYIRGMVRTHSLCSLSMYTIRDLAFS